jgi:calcium-dependent protein kinase
MGCSLSPGISRLHDPDLAFERRISRLESLRSLFTASAEVSFADKYTLETTVLGKGAFGEVYEAISKDLEEKVAVKIIPKKVVDDLTKLKLEVKILKTLKHENILVLYDFFQQDDNYIIVTELIRGGPLTKRLADKKACIVS